MKKDKENALQYIKVSAMKQRINEFGYSLSMKSFAATLLLVAVSCLIASIMFKLKPAYTVMVLLFFLCSTPFLIILRFKFNYQQRKFAEVTLYLQQMAYAFKRKNKILNALMEVEKLTNKKLNAVINEAIEYIRKGEYKENLYKEALEIIERNYKCSRIKNLHLFMTEVEMYGGEYRKTLTTLIQDIDLWVTRTMTFQEKRKHTQKTTTLSIIMALAICLVVVYVLPTNVTDTTQLFNSTFYQLMTSISLIAFIFFYAVVYAKTTTSWLDLEDIKNVYTIDDAEHDYNIILKYNVEKHIKRNILIAFVLFAAGIVVYTLTRVIFVIPAMLAINILLITHPKRIVKSANKRLLKQLTIAFPLWIRSLTLHLQTNNLQVALKNSLVDCPDVLKVEVTRLIKNLEADPLTQRPYILFMEHFDAYDIKMIVRALYGMTEFSKAEAMEQINSIIAQNNEVSAVAEKLSDDLKMSGLHIYTLVPMLLGSVNMFINLLIFSSSFFSYFNTGLTL